jgi:hypothetical protein
MIFDSLNKKNDVDYQNGCWVEQQRNPTQLEGVFFQSGIP